MASALQPTRNTAIIPIDRRRTLYDASNRPIRPLAASAYDAGGSGRRLYQWSASSSGPNTLVFQNATTLRNRARDIVRKNAWAVRAVDAYVAEVVGTGITPQFRHPKPKIRSLLQAAWRQWTDEADADGITDFYGLQALACRGVMEGGETLARLRPRYLTDGLTVPLQLQMLEPDHLPLDKNEPSPTGGGIRAGIEFNNRGQRVAYHLYKGHPGDALYFPASSELSRVNANQITHVYRPLRQGQIRGLPWMAPILLKLYELDKYEDAELVRKGTTAMFGGFITSPVGTPSPLLGSSSLGGNTAPSGTDYVGLEPGSFVDLEPGQEVQFSSPADVGGMYVEFLISHLRAIAAACGITYEQLTGDLEHVSFASSRVGLQSVRRSMEQFQYFVMVYQFCRPVMNAWLEAAALAGIINQRDYINNILLYRDVEWKMPPWPFINPVDDVKAEVLQIRGGLKSRSASIVERGDEPDQVDQQIADDNTRADELGNVYDTDPRKTTQSGGAVNAASGGGSGAGADGAVDAAGAAGTDGADAASADGPTNPDSTNPASTNPDSTSPMPTKRRSKKPSSRSQE
jgi:lambda family phage portal protein